MFCVIYKIKVVLFPVFFPLIFSKYYIMPSQHLSNLDYSLETANSFFDQATTLALAIQELTNELDILNTAVQQTRKILKCDRALIYQFLPSDDGVIIAESVGEKCTPILGQLVNDPCFREKWIENYSLGRISTIEDIYAQPTEFCYLELLQRFQVRANLVVPILIRKSEKTELWGLLIVHQCHAPRQWHSLEIKLLQNIAAQVGIALEKIIKQEAIRSKDKEELRWKEVLLRWKEALLRSMTDNSLLGFYVVDNPTDNILYFNHRFCEIWGIENLKAQMQLGEMKNNDIIPHCILLIADLPAFIESCKPLQSEENRAIIEDEIIFNDGRTIRRFSSQIRDAQDRYFGRLYIFEDVTQRKQNERLWQYALEGNGDGVWDWNIQTNEVFFSLRWKEMLGFKNDEITNNFSEWDQRIHPDDKLRAYEEIEKHKRGETEYYIIEHRLKCKDGLYKWILSRGQILTKSPDGKPLRMIGTHIDITERKRVEEALRESEERYRSVIDAMNEGIVLQQADGQIMAWNKNAEKILGLTSDQMRGRTSIDPRWRAIHEDGSPFPGEDHPSMFTLNTGQSQINVIMGVHKPNGQLTWISINSQPLFNPHQTKAYAVVTSFTDITEKRQLEIDLQQSEALFRGVFEQATVGAAIVNKSGNFLKVNQRFCDLVGYSQSELEQMSFLDITHPDDLTISQEYHTDAWVKGVSSSVDKRYIRKDGQIQWVNITTSPIYNVRGKLQYTLGIVIDISERKQAEIIISQQVERERMLNAISQNIRQSLNLDQILQTTVNEVRDFLQTDRVIIYRLHHDWSGIVVTESVSSGYQAILSMEITDSYFVETQGGTYHDGQINNVPDIYQMGFSQCHIELLEKLQVRAKLVVPILQDTHIWGLLIAHHCSSIREWQIFEMDLLTQLATQVGIAIQQASLFEQVQKELTERRIIETKLQESNLQLERATRAKSEFLANMSHEIRTPMNGVIGMIQLLSMSNLSEEQKDFVKTIQDSGEALLTIINDILDFSKIESGMVELEKNPFRLQNVIKSVCNLFQKQAEVQGINLNYQINNQVPDTILGDGSRLRQIILNLVGNALKFTEKGQVSIVVIQHNQAVFSSEEIELIISVQDTGIGINSDRLKKLFQPFTQADASISRKYGGTGLGLSISKSLVSLMGGTIWVESGGLIGGHPPQNWVSDLANSPITGSKFYFTLRVKAVSLPEINSQITPDQTKTEMIVSPSQLKILLAEDSKVNQKIALLTLKKLGYKADIANNGLEVLDMVEKQFYDVILMDMQMPEMDGITATKMIRQLSKSQPYIIALTANALETDRQICLDVGMNDFISKPIVITQLTEALKNATTIKI